ncbi:DUF881 domain-containing protein [Clostridium cylindrosporum]|uniref:Division initiation protein n=1 Tax=Clostridium cylindrosporum DSM 605 TaxID=1121307 RepID=A0A0J8D5J6_CLOCY|nr:DUF881 domain-containing protein [Clostridium cylindrosporum]KMT21410.1 hypothetical protein CLCY_2c01700 [Clostridium cylindrosporum DSM 605]
MKINEGKLLLLLIGILSGILLVIFIVNNSSEATKILTYNQYKDMKIKSNSLKAENRGLYNKLFDLQKKLNEYQHSGEETDDKVNKAIKEELKYIKLFYGITEVEGPGATITLDDNRKIAYSDSRELTNIAVQNSVVHNVDLFEIVNELRNSGAEAIAINGYRIVAESTITCEGPTIMIDGNNIVPPFEIDVIGDVNALEYTISSQENKFGDVSRRGLLVKVENFKDKTLPRFQGKDGINYMKEVKEGSSK